MKKGRPDPDRNGCGNATSHNDHTGDRCAGERDQVEDRDEQTEGDRYGTPMISSTTSPTTRRSG